MTIARNHGQLIIKGVFALFLLFAALAPLTAVLAVDGVDCLPTDSAVDCAAKKLDEGAIKSQATANDDPTTAPTTAQIIGKLIVVALQIIGLIFFILIVYGGVVWLTAGGSKERADKAVSTLRQATLGLLIIIIAYLVVNFVVFQLAGIATSR